MKAISCLAALALALSFFAGCDPSSDGPSCAQVCDKMVECEMDDDLVECKSICDEFSAVMRPAAYKALGDCYMDNTCDFLQQNGDHCFGQAANEGDFGPVDEFIERMCAKTVTCVDQPDYTQQDCIDEFTGASGGSDDMYYSLSMFKASVFDCVGDCVEESNCDALVGDGIMTCFSACGLDFMVSEEDIEE